MIPRHTDARRCVDVPTIWQDTKDLLPVWVTARALVGLAYLVAWAVVEHRSAGWRPQPWRDGLVAWDGTWYRAVALDGYRAIPLEGIRFFPGYPLTARPLTAFGSFGVTVVLLAVANLAALGFAVALRRLVRDESGDEAWAERAGWLAALFPSAFVLSWAYAEPLFLLTSVGALHAARRGRWARAVPLAAIAGCTRPLGVVLVAALGIEAARQWRQGDPGRRAVSTVAIVAPLATAGLFLAWVQRAFGDWRLPFRVQEELRGDTYNIAARLVRGVADLFGAERFGDGLHTPFALVFVVLAVVVARRLPASYTVFAVGTLVAALAADNLNSLERYGLNAFPLLIALAALLTTQRRERLALAVCGNGVVALAALAWLGVYVP